jgi:hypothetical protein
MMGEFRRLEDLVVYQKLCRLPESERPWPKSTTGGDAATCDGHPPGFPEPRTPNPEP